MTRLSMRGRMALLFMVVVTAVLAFAALSFDYFCHLHFKKQDAQVLGHKLEALKTVLARSAPFDPSTALVIDELLDNSYGYAAAITIDSRMVYSHHNLTEKQLPMYSLGGLGEWQVQLGDHLYTGTTQVIEGWANDQVATIHLALDITHRYHFFEMIRQWFVYTLLISAVLSGALGFALIGRGLKPISRLSKTTSTITANCLDTRIPPESMPVELHELVGNFNAMLERLDQSFLSLSSFSADIAHELRTPLNSMLTQTEVALMKERENGDYKDILFSTLDELRRMSRMVDDMLFLAKADNGMIALNFESQNLTSVASGVLEYYEYAAEEKDIKLALHSSGKTLVRGDDLMLRRAISNLMSNAVRYGEPGTTIDIQVLQEAQWVRLKVTNQGPTVAPEHIEKLFDRFYRIDTARREGSTLNVGLGMAITRSIVEAHEGSVGCRSGDGVTTFDLKLPAAKG